MTIKNSVKGGRGRGQGGMGGVRKREFTAYISA